MVAEDVDEDWDGEAGELLEMVVGLLLVEVVLALLLMDEAVVVLLLVEQAVAEEEIYLHYQMTCGIYLTTTWKTSLSHLPMRLD